MFFIHKYSPKSSDEMVINREYIGQLDIMSKDNSMPHIIFHGPRGSGKKTLINILLSKIYGDCIYKTKQTVYNVNGCGNKVKQVVCEESTRHLTISPHGTNFDVYIINDIVKNYARRKTLNLFCDDTTFKIIVINDIEKMSFFAQTSLRRTMEKYSDTCRFIMWCRSLTKIIPALISRCFLFSLPAPKYDILTELIKDISEKEKIKIEPSEYYDIITERDYNVREILWDLYYRQIGLSFQTSYNREISKIIKNILKCDINSKESIRNSLYNITTTNITNSSIIKSILDNLLENPKIAEDIKFQIISKASHFEKRLYSGRREIVHIEGFINSVMAILFRNEFIN